MIDRRIIMIHVRDGPSALRSPPFMGSSSGFLSNSVLPCDDEKFEFG